MNKIFLHKMYIWTFLCLYIVTALISCIHAIDFFAIGNVKWMAISLAMVFEVGQAMVLSSLLLSNNKSNIMPWCLMIILTSVQVIGNVYSCFSYIAKSGTDYYQYLQKPLLFWIQGVSQETMMIIISWIIGALLPIIALCMTTMVANNIELNAEDKDDSDANNDIKDPEILNEIPIDNKTIAEIKEPIKTVENTVKDTIENLTNKKVIESEVKVNSVDSLIQPPVDKESVIQKVKNVEFKD